MGQKKKNASKSGSTKTRSVKKTKKLEDESAGMKAIIDSMFALAANSSIVLFGLLLISESYTITSSEWDKVAKLSSDMSNLYEYMREIADVEKMKLLFQEDMCERRQRDE